ncbi:stealth family protein [Psychrobacter sp. P11G5]|uniref:Stealth CR1 domain-containing protein n=1 Tax=Psychrobacter sp. P11G5 TaxID=1699624 RepID=UPI00078D4C91|nr:stealth family protein [Psychrobacter sp. P11G5]AMN66416.1 capsule biosynthesis protein CapC [Psychrobacter sp. P11G5]
MISKVLNNHDTYKRKFKKFKNNPGVFFRDYFNKRYPVTNTELGIDEAVETAFLEYSNINTVDMPDDMVIDVVFTWVDNTDKAWQQKYEHHKANSKRSNIGQYATDSARFDNHNELYYSVKAVQKYLPWVRNIYIITDNQVPSWLNKVKGVTIVDHTEIIEPQYLPTFNSHVIEAFLYRIPDLSEDFIYFNDDVFVAKELPKEHFFSANNISSLFVSTKNLYNMQQKGMETPTLKASLRSIELLKRHYPYNIKNPLVHTYFPLKKSGYEHAWQLFEKDIRAFLPNKFRGHNDLNMASFLVPWLLYCESKAIEKVDICYYFNIRSRHAVTRYEKLLNLKKKNASPHSFCANDFKSEEVNKLPDYHERLMTMLERYYK